MVNLGLCSQRLVLYEKPHPLGSVGTRDAACRLMWFGRAFELAQSLVAEWYNRWLDIPTGESQWLQENPSNRSARLWFVWPPVHLTWVERGIQWDGTTHSSFATSLRRWIEARMNCNRPLRISPRYARPFELWVRGYLTQIVLESFVSINLEGPGHHNDHIGRDIDGRWSASLVYAQVFVVFVTPIWDSKSLVIQVLRNDCKKWCDVRWGPKVGGFVLEWKTRWKIRWTERDCKWAQVTKPFLCLP